MTAKSIRKKTIINSKVKTDKKLDSLQIIESEKQKELSKLTFKLNI